MWLGLTDQRGLAILSHLCQFFQLHNLNCLIVQILIGDSCLAIKDLISIDIVQVLVPQLIESRKCEYLRITGVLQEVQLIDHYMSIPAARCLGLFVIQVVAGQLIPAARCHREEAAGARSGGRQAATAPAQSTPIFLKSSRFRKRLETTQNSIKRFMLCKHYTYFKH